MNTSFILMILSASALPLLAIVAVFLRRNFFKGVWKFIFLALGLILLSFAVFSAFKEHSESLSITDVLVGGITALITIYIA